MGRGIVTRRAIEKNDGRDFRKGNDSCLAKVSAEEPIFVLRAQDRLAAYVVRQWALLAEIAGCPPEKVAAARLLADRMEQWPVRKIPD
jgi:hypothetical protein